ncbi:hypothetical protein D038_2254A, partial [Vibrio parahaemolyticus IDH02189]
MAGIVIFNAENIGHHSTYS